MAANSIGPTGTPKQPPIQPSDNLNFAEIEGVGGEGVAANLQGVSQIKKDQRTPLQSDAVSLNLDETNDDVKIEEQQNASQDSGVMQQLFRKPQGGRKRSKEQIESPPENVNPNLEEKQVINVFGEALSSEPTHDKEPLKASEIQGNTTQQQTEKQDVKKVLPSLLEKHGELYMGRVNRKSTEEVFEPINSKAGIAFDELRNAGIDVSKFLSDILAPFDHVPRPITDEEFSRAGTAYGVAHPDEILAA